MVLVILIYHFIKSKTLSWDLVWRKLTRTKPNLFIAKNFQNVAIQSVLQSTIQQVLQRELQPQAKCCAGKQRRETMLPNDRQWPGVSKTSISNQFPLQCREINFNINVVLICTFGIDFHALKTLNRLYITIWIVYTGDRSSEISFIQPVLGGISVQL